MGERLTLVPRTLLKASLAVLRIIFKQDNVATKDIKPLDKDYSTTHPNQGRTGFDALKFYLLGALYPFLLRHPSLAKDPLPTPFEGPLPIPL